MDQRSGACFEEVERLSGKELDRAVGRLVRAERRNVAWVIAHLAEISRRDLHLELGYPSLFDYCVRRLGLSEGSSYLRIQVARKCRAFPQVLESLARGKISLTVAGLLAPHLNEANVEKLLRDSEGKTKRETELYLAGLQPRPTFRPGVRKQPLRAEGAEKVAAPCGSLEEPEPLLEPATPDVYNFRFSGSVALKRKLERLGEVLGIKEPRKNLAGILERALDIALEKKDPKKKLARRKRRAASRPARPAPRASGGPRPDEVSVEKYPLTRKPSRHVPVALRERVLERAGYRCEYRGPGGERCGERAGLEIDHVEPYSRCRSHEERNLRALCRAHNLWSARRDFGAAFIRGKIARRRERRASASLAC